MSVSMKVHEAMIRHVQIGQKVNVTIDARPGTIFQGQVVSKGITAQTGSWFNPNLREYEVMVDLPKGVDPNLKPGMRSLGNILIETVTNKLAVPVQAVHSLNKDRFCYVRGTGARPRLMVSRSLRQIQCQIIDDDRGHTLAAASSLEKELRAKGMTKTATAAKVGALVAERAKKAGVTRISFDRGSRKYHGRVKALADAAREGGLEF